LAACDNHGTYRDNTQEYKKRIPQEHFWSHLYLSTLFVLNNVARGKGALHKILFCVRNAAPLLPVCALVPTATGPVAKAPLPGAIALLPVGRALAAIAGKFPLRTTTIHILRVQFRGLHPRYARLCTSRYRHARGFTTDLSAGLWSGRTCLTAAPCGAPTG
jgi:hypothetical protein